MIFNVLLAVFFSLVNGASKFSDYAKATKLVLVGETGMGKTCLVKALAREPFDQFEKMTIGVDLKMISCLSSKYGAVVTVAVWDTAGHERFKAMTPAYTRGADIVLVVFDMMSHVSMAQTGCGWIQELDEVKLGRQNKVILVGTKFDLVQEKLRTGGEGNYVAEVKAVEEFAIENGFDHGVVVSSSSGLGIPQLLELIGNLSGDAIVARSVERAANVVVPVARKRRARKDAVEMDNLAHQSTSSTPQESSNCCTLL